MVVLAASLCTKAGKPLVSRQFIDMPRSRIEGLLASFPKLMNAGQQHTTIDTETIRYVYQPMDTLYLVLITNRQSNIVQDIDTLHLFARAATDVCGGGGLHEFVVLDHSFELLCAFDEIINLGLRENVNITLLKTIMEMESQEEKIQEVIAKNKEKEAKAELKRRAKQFDQQRKEAGRKGMGSGSGSLAGSFGSLTNTIKHSYSPIEPTITSFDHEPSSSSYGASSTKPSFKGRGMKLGGKKEKPGSGLFRQESELADDLGTKLSLTEASEPTDVYREEVHIEVEERISAMINRDGGVEAMEVKGELSLLVADAAKGNLRLQVQLTDDESMQIKTHPHIDKKRFQADRVLALKDASRSFPVNQPVGLFKWRFVAHDESSLPITINCWPTPTGDGTTDVNIEYELASTDLELKEVVIAIPLPAGGGHPNIRHVDGEYTLNSRQGTLDWELAVIDGSNSSGTLEFTIPGENVDAVFPVTVAFVAKTPFCDLDVATVANAETGEAITFSKNFTLLADDYRVV
ncbi:coatomer subunit delta [Dimargaris verticillata]|uniref:Coatomer subunit delta n=1 Tax=Dimargaris verticillata TaxID=2761393 RepID=A0A9W8B2N6_9FUNG|nr:coatomer subunit delta [Dimargaris verticillata]